VEHVIVWDIETVPDLAAAARVHGAATDKDARDALGDKFPKLFLHQIVCIGALVAQRVDGAWSVTAIGAPHLGDRTEAELIKSFVDRIGELSPRLVTFNGHGFDLPVLRYRAMMNRISAPGLEVRRYFRRYGDDALDLCDALSSFNAGSKMKLNDLCSALNLAGKPDGMDGSKVEQYVREGRITEVAAYCECDVVNTYRLWLLYELFRGTLSPEQHGRSEGALSRFVHDRLAGKPHWARLVDLAPIASAAEVAPSSTAA